MARTDLELEGYVWRLLPDYIREADDGTLATFLGKATASAMAPGLRMADLADPATSVSGTAELANADAIPRPWLPWLGWLVGIDVASLPAAVARDVVRDAAAFQRRGSVAAIAEAVRRTLTGSRDVIVITKPPDGDFTSWDFDEAGQDYDSVRRYDGNLTDPYLLIVVTKTPQTPNSIATLEAAVGEKPAGVVLELQTLSGSTYAQLATAYPTYSAMRSTNRTYGDLASSFS